MVSDKPLGVVAITVKMKDGCRRTGTIFGHAQLDHQGNISEQWSWRRCDEKKFTDGQKDGCMDAGLSTIR